MWCMFTRHLPRRNSRGRAVCHYCCFTRAIPVCEKALALSRIYCLPAARNFRGSKASCSARSGVGLARRQGTLCLAAKMTENIAVFLLVEAGTSAQQGQLATGSSVSSRHFDRDRSDARQNRTPAQSIERAYSTASCARSRFGG